MLTCRFSQDELLNITDGIKNSTTMSCRAVLVVAAAATCIELGFAKAKSSDDKTAASALRPYNAASAMAVLLTFSAIGAFVQLGLGYLEAHFNLLLYGGELVDPDLLIDFCAD